MSFNIGVLNAAVTLDNSDFKRKAGEVPQVAKSNFRKAAEIAAAYLTFRGIFGFSSSAIKTFSDLQEETNKFNVVFQGMSSETNRALMELQKNFGLSELAAKKMLAGTGDILTGFGFDRGTALALSEGAAKLGADIASFSNYAGGAEGATFALTKAMLGEYEAAKMLGVVIRKEDEDYKKFVKQAMTTGVTIDALGKTFIVSSQKQAEAVAAIAVAYQQSPNAIGDFVRSQSSIANQTRILENNFTQLKSTVGEDLSGAYQGALLVSNDLLKSYNELSPASRQLLMHTAALAAGFALIAKTGLLAKGNAMLRTEIGGDGLQSKAEAAAVEAAEAVKQTAYNKTAAVRAAHSKVTEVRIAREAVAEAQLGVARASVNLELAKGTGTVSAQTAAKRQLLVATQALAKAQSAEAQATANVAQAHLAARAAIKANAGSTAQLAIAQGNLARVSRSISAVGKDSWQGLVASVKKATEALAPHNVATYAAVGAQKLLATGTNICNAARRASTVLLHPNIIATKALTGAQTLAYGAIGVTTKSLHLMKSGFIAAASGAKALFAAIGPLGWTLLAVTSAVSLWEYAVGRRRDKLEGMIAITDKAVQKTNEDAEANDRARDAYQKKAERLQELASYTNRNNAEQEEALRLVKELHDRYGDLGITVNKLTGEITIASEAWNKMSEAEKKYAEIKLDDQIRKQSANIKASLQGALSNAPVMDYSFDDNWLLDNQKYKSLVDRFSGIHDSVDLLPEVALGEIEKQANEERKRGNTQYAEQLDTIAEKIKILIQLNNELEAVRRKGAGANKTEKDKSEDNKEQRAAREKLENARREKGMEGASAARQDEILAQKEEELRKKLFDSAGNKPESEYSKEELEIAKQIVDLERQRAEIRKKSADAFKDEAENFSQSEERRARENERRQTDREISKLESEQGGDAVKKRMEQELQKARESAERMKAEYDKAIKDAQEDGVLTDEERKQIQEARRKLDDAMSDEDTWTNKLADYDSKDRSNAKAAVAFSSDMLTAMIGSTPTEKAIEKNTKQSVDLQRDSKRLLEDIRNKDDGMVLV